jgi:hypothetical protein
MNSMTSTIAAPSATVPATAPLTMPHVPPDCATGTCRSIALDTGNVLRIRDGRGLRVTPATGVLWITEENSTTDIVLLAGETHRIAHRGLALVLAHRSALALLEVPVGAAPPRRVEFASNDGAPGRRVTFGTPPQLPVRALAEAVGRFIRNVLSVNAASAKQRRPSPPTDGGLEHDMLHSTRLVRHSRRGLGAQEPLPVNARAAISRDLFFPYY